MSAPPVLRRRPVNPAAGLPPEAARLLYDAARAAAELLAAKPVVELGEVWRRAGVTGAEAQRFLLQPRLLLVLGDVLAAKVCSWNLHVSAARIARAAGLDPGLVRRAAREALGGRRGCVTLLYRPRWA